MVSLLNGEIAKPHREELPLEVVPEEVAWGARGIAPPSLTASWRATKAFRFFRGERSWSHERNNYDEKGSNE